MNQRVLLTGATGFVGRQLLAALGQRGADVTLVLRGYPQRIAPLPTQVERLVLTKDVFAESRAWWVDVLQGIDTVIHAAWYAEPGKYLQSPVNLDCLQGTLTLAQACAAAGVRRFVGIGTCFEYDTDVGHLSINTPLRPATPYAGAKAAAYLALQQSLPLSGVELAWCRLFYLYGAGEDARRLAPYIHQQLQQGTFADLTDGLQVRDYMDVRDAGAAIVAAALGQQTGAINICSGKGITVRDFALGIANTYGRPDLLRFGVRSSNAHDPHTVVGVPN